MRCGDFAVEIVPSGHGSVRELDSGHVLARPGTVYRLRLRNFGPLYCVADIAIDGRRVTGGGLVLRPWSTMDLERPVDDDEDGRFTVAAEGDETAFGPDGGRDNDALGLIDARFRRELPGGPTRTEMPPTLAMPSQSPALPSPRSWRPLSVRRLRRRASLAPNARHRRTPLSRNSSTPPAPDSPDIPISVSCRWRSARSRRKPRHPVASRDRKRGGDRGSPCTDGRTRGTGASGGAPMTRRVSPTPRVLRAASRATAPVRSDAETRALHDLERWRSSAIPDATTPLEAEDLVGLLRDCIATLQLDAAVAAGVSVNTVHYYRRKDVIDPPIGKTVSARYEIRHLWQIAGARLAGHLGLVTLAEARDVIRGADETTSMTFLAARVADARARDAIRDTRSSARRFARYDHSPVRPSTSVRSRRRLARPSSRCPATRGVSSRPRMLQCNHRRRPTRSCARSPSRSNRQTLLRHLCRHFMSRM